MTEDLTKLDGVGPARSDSLAEAGYGDFETIADADPEALAEEAGVTEDKALSFVVQSQNIVGEEEAEVEESQPITEEVAEAVESEEDDVEEEDEPEGPPYTFEVEFNAPLQYDTFFDSVMQQRAKMLRSNRTGVDVFDHALEQMREGGTSEPVVLTMTEAQLNDLHNSVRQKTVSYKGNNLIDHMDELQQVLNQINEARDEYLF